MTKAKKYAKFIAAIIGAAVQAGILTLVPESARAWVSIIAAVLTAIGVYQIPNVDDDQPAGK